MMESKTAWYSFARSFVEQIMSWYCLAVSAFVSPLSALPLYPPNMNSCPVLPQFFVNSLTGSFKAHWAPTSCFRVDSPYCAVLVKGREKVDYCERLPSISGAS